MKSINNVAKDVAILVMSCDAYSDVWEGFSVCINKYWSDCPYPIFLSSESIDAPNNLVFEKTIHTNTTTWSSRLRESLLQLKQDIIMLVLDDIWLSKAVNNAETSAAVAILNAPLVGAVRLSTPRVSVYPYSNNADYLEIPFGQPYRISTAPAFWKKEALLSVLENTESAWEFERLGSFRETSKDFKVLCTKKELYTFLCDAGAVSRGKYNRKVISFSKDNNIRIDLSKRMVISRLDQIKTNIRSFLYNINPKGIVKLQNVLYKLKQKKKHS